MEELKEYLEIKNIISHEIDLYQ